MTIELNLTHLIFIVIAAFSGIWALLKTMAAQHEASLDKRFTEVEANRTSANVELGKRLDALDAAARKETGQWQRVERELLSLKADLPLQYVRREDYIRGQSVIEAKLDALATKMENIQLRAIIKEGTHHAT